MSWSEKTKTGPLKNEEKGLWHRSRNSSSRRPRSSEANNPSATKCEEWISAVAGLLAQIKEWLAQADTQRILLIEEAALGSSEQGLGLMRYPA